MARGRRCRGCRAPHEALVRPIVASRCDGDCLFLFHDFSRALQLGAALHVIDPEVRELGDRPFAGPFAYGHECIAEVIDVGDGVRSVAIGQRVVVPWAISCGACAPCGRGLTSQCDRKARRSPPTASAAAPAAGAAWSATCCACRSPTHAGAGARRRVAARLAGASDNLPDAWRTWRRICAPSQGRRCWSSAAPRAASASTPPASRWRWIVAVDYVDDDRASLAIAEGLGAHPIAMRPRPRWLRGTAPPLPTRYPITVDASNREAGLEFAIRALAPGRRVHRRRLLLPLRDAAAALAHVPEGRAPARRRLEPAGRSARRPRPHRQRALRPDAGDGAGQPLGRSSRRVPRSRRRQGRGRAPAAFDPLDCSAVPVGAL